MGRRGIAPQGGGKVGGEAPGVLAAGGEHPEGHAVSLPQQAQQQVLGAHTGLAQPHRFLQGQLDDVFAAGREPLGGQVSRRPPAHCPDDGGAEGLRVQPRGAEHLGGHTVPLPQQAQQQVLAAHISVSQLGGALLGKAEGGLSTLGEFRLVQRLTSFPKGVKSVLFSPDGPHRHASFLR